MTRLLLMLALAGCTKATDGVDTDDTSTPLEPPAPRSCRVVYRHAPDTPALQVQVAGSFSDWEPVDLVEVERNVWEVDLGELAPGSYPYKHIYGGLWEEAPFDGPSHWEDGIENRDLRVGDCQRPRLTVLDAEAEADGALTAELQFQRAASDAPLDAVVATVGGAW